MSRTELEAAAGLLNGRLKRFEERGVKPPGRKPDMERRQLAAALWAKGWTFTAIGERLGITRRSASHLVQAHQRSKRRGK
jgi:hypothetical protein